MSVQHSVIICQNFTGPQGSERTANKTFPILVHYEDLKSSFWSKGVT